MILALCFVIQSLTIMALAIQIARHSRLIRRLAENGVFVCDWIADVEAKTKP